ncbi:uncharacterized protein GGS22DRAFT_183737 [Annulohypoxylon maeteangense]|uniref:uncharacterized protein n=1 Tax=Annulohypoxylon maeteangense TaxID=1927788 RepID=UPI0020087D83|nr:uncharacterized protein GGS22DRAFT_183737 [Annulohypoxylon maeteangense]KAI0890391.1 hypothetical protein GGS22DRAFT_183737 [Annulohypoxylon maeteangense]
MATMLLDGSLICANSGHDGSTCTQAGKFECNYCHLYCGKNCQKAHWKTHIRDCRKNPLLDPNWRPAWETENREPAFMGGPRLQHFNFKKKYPWGNMPAFDVLNLAGNEGANYNRDLNLLFAASGDIRNCVMTLASIPDGCKSHMKVFLNDRDADVVGRNAIILLLALIEDDANVAADNIIHLWYSSFISQSLYDTLNGKIRQLVQEVCKKIEGKASGTVLGKTWTFGSRSLRLVLAKNQWLELLASLEVPRGLTAERAQDIRRSVALAPERVDFRHRRYFAQPPGGRASAEKFREHGILVPFGAPRNSFTIPNPTLFRDTESWPLKDDADPINGYRLDKIKVFPCDAPANDLYGKLSFLLKDLITRFHRRLQNSNIQFHLLNVNAQDLQNYTGQVMFDRIEVANITDAGYLGMGQTLLYMGPLLKQPSDNRHATLVALFLNAVDEIFDDSEKRKAISRDIQEVWKYMDPKPPTGPYDAGIIVSDIATQQVRDVDKYFDMYMKLHHFDMLCELSGMEFKRKPTIIEAWPLKVKKRPHQKGAKEEFATLLSSGDSGCERYMEWRFK